MRLSITAKCDFAQVLRSSEDSYSNKSVVLSGNESDILSVEYCIESLITKDLYRASDKSLYRFTVSKTNLLRTMPRSKRNKEVALTKVRKAPSKEKKDNLIIKIQDAVENYGSAYVLKVENERNEFLQKIRGHFATTGVLFMGKKNVMKLALGTNASSEVASAIHLLSEKICGNSALLYHFSTFRALIYSLSIFM